MWNRRSSGTSTGFALLIVAGGAWAAVAQDEVAGELHTIRTPGPHRVRPGDLMQIRYKTHSAFNGIATLQVELIGESVRRVGVVSAPIDPDRPGPPGAPYFVIAFLKAERPGPTTVRVSPVTNDGNRLKAFEFKADVVQEQ